jgi:hypothetical protein
MNEYHNTGCKSCESSYLFGWMNSQAKCGIENVVFAGDLIGERFYFWNLLGTVWKRLTFYNKQSLSCDEKT